MSVRYYFKLRSPGPGCQPKEGLVEVNTTPCEVEGYQFHGFADYTDLDDDIAHNHDMYHMFDILEWKYEANKKSFGKIISKLKQSMQIIKDKRFAIVSPSTRPNVKWQISFFDDKGAYSHTDAQNKEEIVDKLLDYGYLPTMEVVYG